MYLSHVIYIHSDLIPKASEFILKWFPKAILLNSYRSKLKKCPKNVILNKCSNIF